MNSKKIFIASVLKPVDDVRHYDKLACSLAKANKYQIFILGKGSEKKSRIKQISFINSGNFSRISIRRLLVQLTFLKTLFQVNPHLVVITSIELLPIAAVMKLIFKYKLIFDVQEDYLSNIKHQTEYNPIAKAILIPAISSIQYIYHAAIDHYILAELSYKNSVRKTSINSTVLENKIVESRLNNDLNKWNKKDNFKLIFSGTISNYSGIKKAIEIFDFIYLQIPNSYLKIIGVYHDQDIFEYLKHKQIQNRNIELFVDNKPIDHQLIVNAIKESHLGIISYIPNKTNENRIPTKLFEYSGYGLPYLIHDHPYWKNRANELGGAMTCDLLNFKTQTLMDQYENLKNWTSEKSVWNEEERQLLTLIESLI